MSSTDHDSSHGREAFCLVVLWPERGLSTVRNVRWQEETLDRFVGLPWGPTGVVRARADRGHQDVELVTAAK